MHPNGNKKTIALPYRFRIEKTAQIFLSEFGDCQAIVSLFRNYGLSGIKMHSNFCIKIRVQIWLRELDLNQRPSGYEGFISHFRYISDIRKSYDNGDIALFFYFDVRQLTHCVQYIGVSFGVKINPSI